MNELIKRLIDCGMSREVAVWAAKRHSHHLEQYVEEIEEASREQMEAVSE